MGKTSIEWLHAPGHAGSVGPDVIKFACETNALVIDWSEMYWNTDELRKFGDGYKHFIGVPARKDVRKRIVNHDVVISTREDAKILHSEEFKLDSEIRERIKYMPARWGKARVIEHNGIVILIVAWHPQPGPLRHTRLVMPGYQRSVKRVQKVQLRLEAKFKPDVVLNGGDLQLGIGKLWVSPNKLADRLGMSWRNHKIDWQMFKGAGWKFESFRQLDPSKINSGMDHLWTKLKITKTD